MDNNLNEMGDGFDLNNWLWFTESHNDQVKRISHLLVK